jgi:hypothetical protein
MKLPHLKNSKKTGKSSSSGALLHAIGRDPHQDWAFIFGITVFSIVVLIFLGFLTFLDAGAKLKESSVSTAAAPITFDAKSLTALLGQFDVRADERMRLLKGYDGPGDPSL